MSRNVSGTHFFKPADKNPAPQAELIRAMLDLQLFNCRLAAGEFISEVNSDRNSDRETFDQQNARTPSECVQLALLRVRERFQRHWPPLIPVRRLC